MPKRVDKLTIGGSYARGQNPYRKPASNCQMVTGMAAIRGKITALRKRKGMLEATIRHLEMYRFLYGGDTNGQHYRDGR